jgi:tetratricopeptide (TPR) repeat protein
MISIRSLTVAALLGGISYAQQNDLEALIENGQWRQASALAEQRLRQDDARSLWLAARVRFAYHDLDKAAELTEKAAALDPKNADYQFLLYEIYGTQAAQASVFRQPGLARKCKKAVDTAVALDPKHIEAQVGLMLYLYQAPGFFGGDKERALAIPGYIGSFNPARGHLAQARLELLNKQPGKARECYRKAVAANPDLHEARVLLARSTGDEAQAREAIRINPKRIDGWDALAYALGRQGKTTELDQVVARMEEPTGLYHGARGLLDGDKDAAKAGQMLRQYLKNPAQGPERPTVAQAERRLKEIKKPRS